MTRHANEAIDLDRLTVLRAPRLLPVFYTERAIAQSGSFSPSMHKPAQVVERWRDRFAADIVVVGHRAATQDELALAHSRAYVESVLSLGAPNGFGNRLPGVAAALPYTTGGLLAAASHAVAAGVDACPIACAPYAGFHHAHHGSGGGFCTFNGLAVTARALVEGGHAGRVLILDCDYHYGDGTTDCLARMPASVSARIAHWSAGARYGVPSDAQAFFRALEQVLAHPQAFDVVLYQAGADPHVNDPLGGFLTSAQLRLRDRMVFEACRERRCVVAWVLAGGYQEPMDAVLDIHDATMEEALAVLAG